MFVHPPEPTAENLRGVLPTCREHEKQHRFLPGPRCRSAGGDRRKRPLHRRGVHAGDLRESRPPQHAGPVVTNCSTSRMTEDLAQKYNVPFYRSAVGEANVVDWMLKHGAVIGGEGNGGVIDPRVVLVRDSFTAMALILDAMAARQLPVSALADELPRYEICKTKIELPREKLADRLCGAGAAFPRRQGRQTRRSAARLAEQMAARAGEQHRAHRSRNRRSPHRRRGPAIMPRGRRRVDGIVVKL